MAYYPTYAQQQPQPQQMYSPPQMWAMQQQQEPQRTGIKGRPVSSIDEVRATSIDFDGSIFFFPDLANKRIYTKQINIDGTSTLNVYELTLNYEPQSAGNANYITREEFEKALTEIKEKILTPTPTAQVDKKIAQQF